MTKLTAVIEKMIAPERGDFSPELARYVLSLNFPADVHARYEDLSNRIQRGQLSKDETEELDEYVLAAAFLATLQSKARISLKEHGCAA